MIFLYEVFQDLQIKGTISKHSIIILIIITWTDWDVSEIILSYLTEKKLKMENKRSQDWMYFWIDRKKKHFLYTQIL